MLLLRSLTVDQHARSVYGDNTPAFSTLPSENGRCYSGFSWSGDIMALDCDTVTFLGGGSQAPSGTRLLQRRKKHHRMHLHFCTVTAEMLRLSVDGLAKKRILQSSMFGLGSELVSCNAAPIDTLLFRESSGFRAPQFLCGLTTVVDENDKQCTKQSNSTSRSSFPHKIVWMIFMSVFGFRYNRSATRQEKATNEPQHFLVSLLSH